MASRWKDVPLPAHPGRPAPWLALFVRRRLLPVLRAAFRPTLEGTEHLPKEGAYLLVANHSAGMAIAEISCIAALWLERFGEERPLAGFTHPLSFRIFPISRVLAGLGAIPSTYEAAEACLRAGVPILVFPGGDHESMRPVWQAHRVDFGGRRGFLRIAQAAGVPVVPMGIRGSSFTAPILWRSDAVLPTLTVVPRLAGLKRWPLTALGLAGATALMVVPAWSLPWRATAAWAWLGSGLTLLPVVPATVRFRIGEPLPLEELFAADDPALDGALARVEAAVQRLVDELGRD